MLGSVHSVQIQFHKHSRKSILFFVIIILFSIVSLFAANAPFLLSDKIYQGVSIGNVQVGGLSQDEACEKLTESFNSRTAQPILITYKDRSWPIDPKTVDLKIEAKKLAQNAYEIGRNGNIFTRIQDRYTILNQGYTIPFTLAINETKLQVLLNQIADQVDQESNNATIRQSGSSFVITSEQIGHKVDVNKAFIDVNTMLTSPEPYRSISYGLPVNDVIPDIVAKDFTGIEKIIASYTTQFNSAAENRTENIIIAARALNETLVKSGETFSFNATIGPRIAKNGYKEAPVYLNGKLVPDWGGGVCQVSSTLYNAALLSDMNIVERTSHYQPPGYVPLGQDATVADNQLDLKFVNTSSNSIFITSAVYGNQITVQIWGKDMGNITDINIIATDKKIIEPNTIVKQDPELELGKEIVEEQGQKGFIVTTYRIKTQNGNEISREFLATDDFPPTDKIVRVGIKTPTPVKTNK